jgi:RNA polymerase sigma-70 factor (ECF subfamily)
MDRRQHSQEVGQWISQARHGCRDALGQLLDTCRQYLLLVANQQLDTDLQDKIGPSDLVQETFLEAQRDFGRFHGTSEEELLLWLRRILLNNLANTIRNFRAAAKREIGREVAFALELKNGLIARSESPSAQVVHWERDELLKRALEHLPEPSRQVIHWRNYERCSFAEIGQRLGRSAEAARKVWVRALEQLRQFLEPPHESR